MLLMVLSLIGSSSSSSSSRRRKFIYHFVYVHQFVVHDIFSWLCFFEQAYWGFSNWGWQERSHLQPDDLNWGSGLLFRVWTKKHCEFRSFWKIILTLLLLLLSEEIDEFVKPIWLLHIEYSCQIFCFFSWSMCGTVSFVQKRTFDVLGYKESF